MKEKAKQIFALCGVFICILTLLSSIIFTIVSASEMPLNDKMAYYVECIKREYFIKNRSDTEKYVSILYNDTRMETLFYDENDVIKYDNGIYFEGVTRMSVKASGFPFDTVELDDGTHITGINSWSDVNVNQKYTISENITFILTNDVNMVEALKSIYNFTDDNVVGGLPITEEDLYVSYDYINSNHRFNIRNLSTKEIYIELFLTKGIMYSDSAFRIYTHSFLNSISNQYYKIYTIDDIKNAEYNIRLEYMCNAIWNSETYQNELQYNIKTFENFEEFKTYMNENSNMWDKEHYYKGNTTGLLDWLSGLYISSVNKYSAFKSDIMNYQLRYVVNGENAYGYKKSYCMKPNEEITIEIANNSFVSEKNISYLWHVMYSQTENQYKEHSIHSFMQNETINNVFNNHYNDNDIYDADGNKVGIIDENGVIKDIENNVDIQVPTISVNSISDVLNTAGTFVQASYKILPSEVYGIIVYGVSVIILVGVTKAVLS